MSKLNPGCDATCPNYCHHGDELDVLTEGAEYMRALKKEDGERIEQLRTELAEANKEIERLKKERDEHWPNERWHCKCAVRLQSELFEMRAERDAAVAKQAELANLVGILRDKPLRLR